MTDKLTQEERAALEFARDHCEKSKSVYWLRAEIERAHRIIERLAKGGG